MPPTVLATESRAPPRMRRGLYAITPELDDTAALVALVDAVLAGGAVMLQYRRKGAGDALRHAQAAALAARCREAGVPMIVNDDARLACAVGASGVHLGRDDGRIAEARDLLPGGIIGVSCYDDFTRAERALAAGADYVAFGSIFPSTTKPGAALAGIELLARAAALEPRPVVAAIGGITPANAGPLVDAGCDLLAVIHSLSGAPDPAAVASAFRRFYENG